MPDSNICMNTRTIRIKRNVVQETVIHLQVLIKLDQTLEEKKKLF